VNSFFDPKEAVAEAHSLIRGMPITKVGFRHVLHNADGDLDAVRSSGDLAGEDPVDCTDTDPPLWPPDHLGVVVRTLIDKPKPPRQDTAPRRAPWGRVLSSKGLFVSRTRRGRGLASSCC
jgi:hypothetical protein